MVLSYYVGVKLPEESSNGTVMCSPTLPCPLPLSISIVAEKDEPLCREDFRRPGVLSVYLFEQKQYIVAGRQLNPRARPNISWSA